MRRFHRALLHHHRLDRQKSRTAGQQSGPLGRRARPSYPPRSVRQPHLRRLARALLWQADLQIRSLASLIQRRVSVSHPRENRQRPGHPQHQLRVYARVRHRALPAERARHRGQSLAPALRPSGDQRREQRHVDPPEGYRHPARPRALSGPNGGPDHQVRGAQRPTDPCPGHAGRCHRCHTPSNLGQSAVRDHHRQSRNRRVQRQYAARQGRVPRGQVGRSPHW